MKNISIKDRNINLGINNFILKSNFYKINSRNSKPIRMKTKCTQENKLK